MAHYWRMPEILSWRLWLFCPSLYAGTRGARVLIGLVSLAALLTLISQMFRMEVMGGCSTFSGIHRGGVGHHFQPELRRAGGTRFPTHLFILPRQTSGRWLTRWSNPRQFFLATGGRDRRGVREWG